MTQATEALKKQTVQEIQLDEGQQLAVERCTDMSPGNRIIPVTGPAGTGKTTIIRIVYETLVEAGYNVALCAPTGKAAKRIYEATGIPAVTIHRLLEYPHPGERDEKTGKPLSTTDPKRRASNPLDEDVILADEYAMVNLSVHSNLIHALGRGARLIMFGDVNQLRPIETAKSRQGKPSPFEVALYRFNGVRLTNIHRQGEGSGIAQNGTAILNGRVPKRFDDFHLRITDKPVDSLTDLVLSGDVDYRSTDNQILTTSKKTWVGTYKLNILLQGLLNPDAQKKGLQLPRHKWDEKLPIKVHVGDKVIWTENSYDLRNEFEKWHEEPNEADPAKPHRTLLPVPPNKMILNGETGIITEITDAGEITIDLGDRIVDVPNEQYVEDRRQNLVSIDPRQRIDLAYAITVHKAQGSEYKNVVYVLNKSSYFMQCRSNMYTAITRARECATIIADQRSLQASVFNIQAPIERNKG